MLVRAVTAHAFGPFSGDRLDLADGMTVVHGPNESGKSTWHAAVYLALCGRRRGRGRAGPDWQRLADRHRPWDRDEWLVSAEVVLDDGRRVEFRQDLDGRVDCHARDLVLGADLSAEFMNDGTPDAARWLGLDRHSFAATACIGQAQMLAVLERADTLQEHLQRAAATAGADSTAAAALARMDAFRAERVGGDRATTKPLRQAMTEVQAAREALEEARTGHALYQRRLAEVDRLRAAGREAEHRLRVHEAAAAAILARDLRARADETAGLLERLGGVDPSSPADTVADPAPPDPDLGPADEELWDLAAALDAPLPAAGPGRGAASDAADPAMPVESGVAERAAAARDRLAGATRARTRRRLLYAGSVLAVLAALALVARDAWAVAAVLAGAAAVLAHLGYRARSAADPRAVRAELESLRVEEAAARQARESALARRDAAAARCVRLGLPAEPAALRARARERAGGVVVATRDRQWRHEWHRARLLTLLDGRTPDRVRDAATAAERRAAAAASELPADEVRSLGAVDEEALAELRAAARSAAEESIRAQASLRERADALPSVAAAEERLARAEAALARVRQLDETLDLTRRFLADAQERAHRDIAPVLAESVRRTLPDVTAGRYTDVIVDPATLRVRVCGPRRRWRDAALLSHGTAEQIYLLLRIALAEALTRDGRVCPLLLDDVTVHADADRTAAVLEVLASAAREGRQIILFTQQAEVRDWARTRLAGPRHALVELAPLTTV